MERLMMLIRRAWQFLRSSMARPYLDAATNYVELQLNRAGLGDFEVEVESDKGMVHYMVVRDDIKYTVTVTVGEYQEDPAIDAARREFGDNDVETEITLDLSQIVGYSPSMMLPYNVIDKLLKPVVG